MPLQIRRGLDTERTSAAIPFAVGELIYVTDTNKLYIGDGTTLGGIQVTGFDSTDAVDAIGAALLAGNAHNNNITFIYGPTQQLASRIDATVNLSTLLADLDLNNYNITGTGNVDITGSLTATAFNGTVQDATGATTLVDGTNLSINLNGTVKDHIIPDANQAYDLGSNSFRFRDLYLKGTTIHLGSASITSSGTAVDLPIGSTIGGNNLLAANAEGIFQADINGSVFGDDSTMLVDASNGNFHGTFNGVVNGEFINVPDGSLGLEVTAQSNASFQANFHNGTQNSKVAIAPGSGVGSISIKGWNGSAYEFAGAIVASWDADAVTTDANPKSSIVFASGGGGSTNYFAGLSSNGTFSSNTFSAANGTATEPSYVFGYDVSGDTGFFHPGDGQIGVSINGTEKLHMDDGGLRVVGFVKVGGFATGSLPSPAEAGMIVLDTSTNQFKGYNGSAWVVLG